jgi:hypothetical protein
MDVESLVGQELSSVTFVQDYLQLEFNGPSLTLFVWPEIFREEGSYGFGEPGYRDWLCAEIGEEVSEATIVIGEAFELQFEDGIILRASLREEDLDVTDAGHFLAGQGQPLVVF